MALFNWGDLRISRTLFRETWDATEATGRTLDLKGQEACPPNPRATVLAQHDNLLGLEDGLVLPVTFTDKPERDCYAMVDKISAVMSDWNGDTGGVVTSTWSASLTRCGSGNEIDLQSRLTGTFRQNAYASTGESTHAPPLAHFAYYTGANSPASVTRTGEDGALKVYRAVPAGVMPKWGCAPADYPGGRVRVEDTSGATAYELEGTDRRAPAGAWRLSNGLVRVLPGAGIGTLDVQAYTGGAWRSKGWDVLVAGTALAAWDSATIVHNTMEHIVLRLTSSRAPGRVSLDLALRRGSRVLEAYLQTGTSTTLAFKLRTGETGARTSGYVTATANDAAGNRYVVGSAKTFTTDTTGGASNAAAVAMDAFLGVAAGGSGAVSGDAAADLFAQYIGALPEAVYAVRR